MTAILILLKATLLVAASASGLALFGRRMSAASRHLLCALTIGGLLLLPFLSWALPEWTAVQLAASGTPAMAPHIRSLDSSGARAASDPLRAQPVATVPVAPDRALDPAVTVSWPVALLAIYAAGVLFFLARLIADRVSIRRHALHAVHVTDPDWQRLQGECAERLRLNRNVRLLRTFEQVMPMAIGIRNGAILVPAVADTWPCDRRRAVLLHELAHVARYDCLTQTIAAVACALYWIHPGVWWMARRLRIERELACDDVVVAAGADPRDYAGHLLELAYALQAHPAMALAVSMAGPRQLEGRMLALLDAARNRTAPALRGRLLGVAILAAVLVPIAAVTAKYVPTGSQPARAAPDTASQPAGGDQQRATTAPASADLPGTWEVRRMEGGKTVRVRLSEEHGTHGFTMDIERLEGLSPGALVGPGGPVQFTVRREAGTFTFEGIVRNGVGAGTFDFTPSDAFAAELVKRGFDRPTPSDQRQLAYADIGIVFLDELSRQGYARPDRLAELLRLAAHGVSLSYVREMGELGYRLGRVERLIEQRNHGVSPQFIRELAAAGLPRLSSDELLAARNHGVSPEYIRELDALGIGGLSLEGLIEARNRGISPEFVRDLRALGYQWSLDALGTARNHGIDATYIREMSAVGYERLPLETLVRLRNHGIESAYVRELQELGYTGLTIDDLVGLRNHGVAADQIRQANARAGARLSVERLKALASTGWR